MASSKTLNAKNLEAMGAARLAALLIDISTGNATAKRRLRLELAGEAGGDLAHEVRKRLITIGKSRSYIGWEKVKPLITDLTMQHRAIVDQIAKTSPKDALDLLWRFMALAENIFARCDDGSGRVRDVFVTAAADLAPLALAAKTPPMTLAQHMVEALCGNDYGQYGDLVTAMVEPLGEEGLAHLNASFTALDKAAPTGGEYMARHVLKQIADAQNDVNGFIAQYDAEARRMPHIADEIARRLLNAGRTDEAWVAINAIDESRLHWHAERWSQTRVDIIEALGRADEAQAFRWACFEDRLSADHLRAYIKRLPDFDDIEAEDRALNLVLNHVDFHRALHFLILWPAIDYANQLILDRFTELNGDHYELLTPTADALEPRHPLAATLVRRAMIDFALSRARVKRYPHAARHLRECESLAKQIADYGIHADHDAYVEALMRDHGRKSAFWAG